MHERRLARPLRLRTRVMISFALGAALLSIVLSAGTYALTRRTLLNQRHSETIDRAYLDAQSVQSALSKVSVGSEEVNDVLQSYVSGSGSYAVILVPDNQGGQVTGSTNAQQFVLDQVPTALQRKVAAGQPATMRTDVKNNGTMLVVGLPLPELQQGNQIGQYYEFSSLEDIAQTLNTLTPLLIIAMAATTALGTLLGWWVSRGVLRPLGAIGLAAEAIAGGRLNTRLNESPDPDLSALVDSFNHMAEALETRIDQDARFTSDVSHELRSPITTLTASMEVIESRRDDIPEGPVRSAVDLMAADLERFQQLVEDLLEISRYDAGAIQLELSEIRIVELVRAVVASQHLDTPVEVDPELTTAIVRVDKRRLSRVIANLLDNATKYGGHPTRVEISMVDDHLRIGVEDEGPGVPEADRALIFDRFSRGSAAGRRNAGSGGVGLGLALVSEHLRLQGGAVWVEDRPDGNSGARFVVELGGGVHIEELDEEPVS